MLVQTTLAALLLGAVVTVEASMVSMHSEGMLTFCGKHPCFNPNKCLPFLGVDVCCRTPAPTCAKTLCPEGHECALLQDLCHSRPCYPKPYCLKKNPCGDCDAPDKFCQLLPKPECRFVVEPTCDNKICQLGEICHEKPLECHKPPCRVMFVCDSAWPWRYTKLGANATKLGASATELGASATELGASATELGASAEGANENKLDSQSANDEDEDDDDEDEDEEEEDED